MPLSVPRCAVTPTPYASLPEGVTGGGGLAARSPLVDHDAYHRQVGKATNGGSGVWRAVWDRAFGRAVAVLVVLCVVGAVAAPMGHAASIAGWSVEPSGPAGPGGRAYFVYQMQAGARLQDTVGVTNSSDQALTFSLYARDAFTPTGSGGMAFQQESEQPEGAGAWISLPVDHYTLAPGTRVDISFTISVPADAGPGDHAAGIIGALVAGGQPPPSTSGLRIEQRLAARVYVRVEGDLNPAIEVGALDVSYDRGSLAFPTPATATVNYRIDNTGDVRLSPDVVITLEDLAGRRVARSPAIRLAEILPGGSASGTYTFSNVLAVTRLSASLRAGTLGVTSASDRRTASVWVISWPTAGGGLLVIAAVIVAMVRRRRRKVSRG